MCFCDGYFYCRVLEHVVLDSILQYTVVYIVLSPSGPATIVLGHIIYYLQSVRDVLFQ